MNEILKENLKKRIYETLDRANRKAISPRDLKNKCCKKRNGEEEYNAALAEFEESGVIFKFRNCYAITRKIGCFRAKVKSLSRTFGFITRIDDGADIFTPGKFMMGAVPGDIVIARLLPPRTERMEAEIVCISKETSASFSGEVSIEDGQYYVIPDTLTKSRIRLEKPEAEICDGDKILAVFSYRGSHHADHRAKMLVSFGAGSSAKNCIDALLAEREILVDFPSSVIKEADKLAKAGISEEEKKDRIDLRGETIFTIDGADSKDLDDAVSLELDGADYLLGVHIADVSHYVAGHSDIDNEAYRRGTSIYYADTVIPMLPKSLSNGICSLNPDEDRLTLSCNMRISESGKLLSYDFRKSVIRSRVKGIYDEANAILDRTASPETEKKYADVRKSLFLMEKLASILNAARKKRGSPMLETTESKVYTDEEGKCCGIEPRISGKAENIIEEFMLMANQSAALFAAERQIPFIYRVHEQPAPEKIASLKRILLSLGLQFPYYSDISPIHFAQIIETTRGNSYFPIINRIVLRSMAKAKYSDEPLGHFGLALDDYTHFTSPIRRYPDLAIHRIMSELLATCNVEKVRDRYVIFAHNAAEQSSSRELNAMRLERDCEERYKAEYMLGHIGEEYDAIITSITEHGFYVSIPNTVEGLVPLSVLPQGCYSFDEPISMADVNTGTKYMMGNALRVRCIKSDVSSGNVDFAPVTSAWRSDSSDES